MARRAEPSSYGHPKRGKLRQLLGDLRLLRSEMLELEASCRDAVGNAHAEHSPSARNLMHYLALRRHDIRPLQTRLANIGLSSLGRSEPPTLSALRTVIEVLEQLAGCLEEAAPFESIPRFNEGSCFLQRNTEALLGPAPEGRNVRIMVTMPSEAASDYVLVRDLVAQGMDCMRLTARMMGRKPGQE